MRYEIPTHSGYYWARHIDHTEWKVYKVDINQPYIWESGWEVPFNNLTLFLWGPEVVLPDNLKGA